MPTNEPGMAQIIPFPGRRRVLVEGTEAPPAELPQAEPTPVEFPQVEPRVVVPPRPMSVWRMMGCAVLAVFGMGVLLVMLSLTVADPLEGEDSEGEEDSQGSPYGSPVGAEDQSGPAWLSAPGR
jgi:hypothetical protein